MYDALVGALNRHDTIAERNLSAEVVSGRDSEGFTQEAVLVGRLLRRDFEISGIHLEPKEQQDVTRLTAGIHQTGFSISKLTSPTVNLHRQISMYEHALKESKQLFATSSVASNIARGEDLAGASSGFGKQAQAMLHDRDETVRKQVVTDS